RRTGRRSPARGPPGRRRTTSGGGPRPGAGPACPGRGRRHRSRRFHSCAKTPRIRPVRQTRTGADGCMKKNSRERCSRCVSGRTTRPRRPRCDADHSQSAGVAVTVTAVSPGRSPGSRWKGVTPMKKTIAVIGSAAALSFAGAGLAAAEEAADPTQDAGTTQTETETDDTTGGELDEVETPAEVSDLDAQLC